MISPGAVLDAPPDKTYLKRLTFAEVLLAGPLPRPSKLRRWREEAGKAFTYSLVAPPAKLRAEDGSLKLDDTMRAGLEWTRDAALEINARFVVLNTENRLSTGQRDRDHFRAIVGALREGLAADIVWSAGGLWEPEQTAAFAESLDLLVAVDPAEDLVARPETVYARLGAMGNRQRFSDDLLVRCIENLEPANEAFVAIFARHAVKSSLRLLELSESSAGDSEEE
jgi:hypothetical protein